MCRNQTSEEVSHSHPLDDYFHELVRRRRLVADSNAAAKIATAVDAPALRQDALFSGADMHNLLAAALPAQQTAASVTTQASGTEHIEQGNVDNAHTSAEAEVEAQAQAQATDSGAHAQAATVAGHSASPVLFQRATLSRPKKGGVPASAAEDISAQSVHAPANTAASSTQALQAAERSVADVHAASTASAQSSVQHEPHEAVVEQHRDADSAIIAVSSRAASTTLGDQALEHDVVRSGPFDVTSSVHTTAVPASSAAPSSSPRPPQHHARAMGGMPQARAAASVTGASHQAATHRTAPAQPSSASPHGLPAAGPAMGLPVRGQGDPLVPSAADQRNAAGEAEPSGVSDAQLLARVAALKQTAGAHLSRRPCGETLAAHRQQRPGLWQDVRPRRRACSFTEVERGRTHAELAEVRFVRLTHLHADLDEVARAHAAVREHSITLANKM